jgi:hypothetical protein
MRRTVLKCVRRAWIPLAFAAAALAGAPAALADDWLPHPDGATWTYQWTDSTYNPTPTTEQVTVKSQTAHSFILAWTTVDQGNSPDAPDSIGTVSFQETNSGLTNTDWSSNAPPPDLPVLCASASQCGNSLASTYYNVIWGSRSPTLAGPLVKGLSWTSTGGSANDVSSTNRYLGVEQVTVPAFPQPVLAAKIRSDITQSGGALGDPYGSGVRTIWWVWGVGPVKIVFNHAGGSNAPVTTSVLQSTTLTPKPPPSDADYFPLVKGTTATYSWTNRHFKDPVVETISNAGVSNGSAQFTVTSVSGPIKVSGAYGFTLRLDGLTNIWATTKSQSIVTLPPLGPAALPRDKRRHFVTPFDLMDFGFNPILPAYPATGSTWAAATNGRDFDVYGATGTTRVLGVQHVVVPAGKFTALAVQTTLNEPGFSFGSGTRTSWFAPDKGLVKLVFRHRDGSVSTIVLLK